MPWTELTQVQDRAEFIGEWLDQRHEKFSELCGRYSISRKTGYRGGARFKEVGVSGLEGRRRGCQNHPRKTDEVMVQQLIVLRKERHQWGPKKLCAWLRYRDYEPPAPSTVGEILKREGLTKPQKKRRPKPGDYSSPLSPQNKGGLRGRLRSRLVRNLRLVA